MFHTKMLHRPHTAMLILRLVVGGMFIYAGYTKLADMNQTVAMFSTMGFTAFWAWVASLTEFIGGIMLVVGIGTQIAGILLLITMAVAVIKVTGPNGFMMSMSPIALGAAALAIGLSGCGRYSGCKMMHSKDCAACKENGTCGCQHK